MHADKEMGEVKMMRGGQKKKKKNKRRKKMSQKSTEKSARVEGQKENGESKEESHKAEI